MEVACSGREEVKVACDGRERRWCVVGGRK